jgi:hypothetical protein
MFDGLRIFCNYSRGGFTQWDYVDDVDDVGVVCIGSFHNGESIPTVMVVVD